MSTLLFDSPGPKARARHRLYTVLFIVVLVAIAVFVVLRLRDKEVLTSEVINDAFQDNNIDFLLEGLGATLKAAGISIVTSVVVGALLAVGKLSDHAVVRWPCAVVVEYFRAVPVLLLMIFAFYFYSFETGTRSFVAVITGLTLYNGAVLAEVFRAGVNAVPPGQSEAAYALGLRKTQVMSIVLMPQAVKFMLPAIISQCVIVLKDTSLGAIIIYDELVRHGRQVVLFVDGGSVVVYFTVALVFVAINYSLSKLAQYLEHRLSRRGQRQLAEKVEAVATDTGA